MMNSVASTSTANAASVASTSTQANASTPTHLRSAKRKCLAQPLRTAKFNRRKSAVHGDEYSPTDTDEQEYEDLEWYTGQLSGVITLTSPSLPVDEIARQQCFALPQASTRQYAPVTCTSPSAQLDPQFPRSRVYPPVPTRSPPAVPTKRLPPRMSIPIDIQWEDIVTSTEAENTPLKSIAEESPEVEFTVDFGLPGTPIDFQIISDEEAESRDSSPSVARALLPLSSSRSNISLTPPRGLRSHWSSSTLALSLNDEKKKSWNLKGRLLGFSKKPRVRHALPPPIPTTRTKYIPPRTPFVRNFPMSPPSSSNSSNSSASSIRRSTSSRSSSNGSSYASSDVSVSSRLRRKPIPIELFIRSAI